MLVPACVPFLSRCVKSVCLPARARSLARRSVCWCAGRCVGSRWLTVRACVSGEPLPDGAMARFLSLFASPRSSHSSASRVVLSRFSLSLFPSVFLLRLRRLRLLLVASLAHLLSLSLTHFLLNSFLPCALAIDRIENSKELMCAIGKIENLRYKVTIDTEEPPIKGRNLNRARPRVFLRLSLTESLSCCIRRRYYCKYYYAMMNIASVDQAIINTINFATLVVLFLYYVLLQNLCHNDN